MNVLAALVGWSLRNRPIVLFATILFVIASVRAGQTLSIDAVPDITNVQVQVITPAPALSPVEIEQYVTVPVERAMAGTPFSIEMLMTIAAVGAVFVVAMGWWLRQYQHKKALEHPLIMILAVVAVHVGQVLSKRAKSDKAAARNVAIAVIVSLLLVVLGMPNWAPGR